MTLPTRKKQKKAATRLPTDFLNSVASLLKKQFKKSLDKEEFLVYGDIYPEEAILCISLSHSKSLRSASFHLSVDLPPAVGDKPDLVTEQLKSMVDIAASWFAQCFEKGKGLEPVLEEMREMDTGWQEFTWEGKKLFVKINRENYALENAASKLLKKAGFEDDEDLDDDELLKEIEAMNDDEKIH